jgi:membrane-associated protease RseP (regulator of RpoE activity)
VPVALFAATCVTTFLAGSGFGAGFDVSAGVAFGGALMAILVAHELGHYAVARWHRVDVSLPYFIPLPPLLTLGTMGAVIRMSQPLRDRNQLLDVAAAGPLAGMAVALPLLVYGVALSPVAPIDGGVAEGNSLLYIAIKLAVHGRLLPGSDGLDVQLHPLAFAAWVGLLITMINLIPIGQLDGGHIAKAIFGDRHERMSLWLHRGLLVVGLAVVGWVVADVLASGALPPLGAAVHGLSTGAPWLVWAALLALLKRMGGGEYHPAVEGAPLTGRRRALVAGVAVLFVVIFTPVPLRENLVPLLELR